MTRRKQLESFGAMILLLLLIGRWQRSWYYVYAAAVLGLVFFCWPLAARRLSEGWMMLGKAIGAVTGRVLLLVLFVLLVVPLGFIARWRGWLGIELKRGRATYYTERDHPYESSDLERPW